MDRQFAILYRSQLLRQAQGLADQRASVLATVALLEKTYHIEKGDHHERSISEHLETESRENIEQRITSNL